MLPRLRHRCHRCRRFRRCHHHHQVRTCRHQGYRINLADWLFGRGMIPNCPVMPAAVRLNHREGLGLFKKRTQGLFLPRKKISSDCRQIIRRHGTRIIGNLTVISLFFLDELYIIYSFYKLKLHGKSHFAPFPAFRTQR